MSFGFDTRPMNGHELNALRKLLMLSTSEAASHIGDVSVRTWVRWESDSAPVPDDVFQEMQALSQLREDLLTDIYSQVENGTEDFPYYPTFEHWKNAGRTGNLVSWRIWQSALADLYVNEQEVRLV